MEFKMIHLNFNVADVARSIAFYQQAFGLQESRRKTGDSFTIVYLADASGGFQLELTQLFDHPQPYELGENELHLAFAVEDYPAAHALHEAMGCICFENPSMGLYFVEDPDGYWLEVVPAKR